MFMLLPGFHTLAKPSLRGDQQRMWGKGGGKEVDFRTVQNMHFEGTQHRNFNLFEFFLYVR